MERWNMDEAFYRLLDAFKKGIKPRRENVKSVIQRVCKVYGVTRESLGIIAGSRAVIYFEGESYSVGYDAILRLAEMGVDHVCVEKDGVCEILADRAEKYGIALVNTRGHLTDYCERLMIAAEKSGATVVIITDYEYAGIGIASESPLNVHWIGVNDEMLEYFHLSKEEVAVDAENKKSKDDVQTLVKSGWRRDFNNRKEIRKDDRFLGNIDLKFLASGRRIEINSVLAKVESE
jgi:DNA topoisomerase VI subunit A